MIQNRERNSFGTRAIETMRLSVVGLMALSVIGLAACGDDTREVTRNVNDPESSAESGGVGETEGVYTAAPVELVSNSRAGVPATESADEPKAPAPPRRVTWAEAEAVFQTGDYAESMDLFEAYTARKPENPWGYYMVGISAWRAGELDRAEAALKRTVEIDPEHGKGLLNLARVLLDRDRPADALEIVERAVELDPESGETRRVLGNVHAELDATEKATAAYRKALELNPEDAWAMNNLAMILIRTNQFDAALPPLARATALRPEVAEFQNNLGIVLERKGYPAEAAAAYRKALETRPDYEKASVSLARVEAHVPDTPSDSLDLNDIASTFAEDVLKWSADSVPSENEVPAVEIEVPEMDVKSLDHDSVQIQTLLDMEVRRDRVPVNDSDREGF